MIRAALFCLSAAAFLIPEFAAAQLTWLDSKQYPARVKNITWASDFLSASRPLIVSSGPTTVTIQFPDDPPTARWFSEAKSHGVSLGSSFTCTDSAFPMRNPCSFSLVEDTSGNRDCSFYMSANRMLSRPPMVISVSCELLLDLER